MHGPAAHTFEIDATDTAPSIPPPYEVDPPAAAPTTAAADSDHESAAELYGQIAAALIVLALLLAR